MADAVASDTGTETGFDMAAAVESIGAQLFPPESSEPDGANDVDSVAEAPVPIADAPHVRQAPKSWAKDVHDVWAKIDPAAQDYIEKREKDFLNGLEQYKSEAEMARTFKQVVTPYQQTLKQLGIDELTAAKHLFQADHLLRHSTPEQKRAYAKQLMQSYGIEWAAPAADPAAPPPNPELAALKEHMAQIQQALTAQQQAAFSASQAKVQAELDAFAADKAHPYFDEVASDMMPFLQAGLPLQEAYDKAIWANAVTREKELHVRVQTDLAKQKENARLEALPKAKAAKASVRSVDTNRPATQPVGTFEETAKQALAELRARGR